MLLTQLRYNQYLLERMEEPRALAEVSTPKSEFAKRQEWLDSFRKKHRRQNKK